MVLTTQPLPLPVMMDDGSVQIAIIPRMPHWSFEVFLKHLEVYRSYIELPDTPPSDEREKEQK